MLVLGRKTGESIQIVEEQSGAEIWVKVWEDGRGFIKVGIEAPDNYKILRDELVRNGGNR